MSKNINLEYEEAKKNHWAKFRKNIEKELKAKGLKVKIEMGKEEEIKEEEVKEEEVKTENE